MLGMINNDKHADPEPVVSESVPSHKTMAQKVEEQQEHKP
jgi:hypothetical protein